MRSQRPHLIMSVAFLSMNAILLNGLQINYAYASDRNFEIEQINGYLQMKHILTPDEQNELSRMVNNLIVMEKNLLVLQNLSLKILQKVENDKNGLEYFLVNFEKLANDKYARAIGKVTKSDIKDCWNLFDKLQRNIEEYHSPLPRFKERLNAEYYLQIIKNNSVFLVGGEDSVTIFDLWESIKEVAKPVYLTWSRKKIDLSEKVKKYRKDFQSSSDILTYEEEEFIVKFNEVQVGLRKFSESDSTDF